MKKNSFIKTAKNGDKKTFYEAFCDKCNKSRGYKPKIKMKGLCRSCSQKHSVLNFSKNVDKNDFIQQSTPTKGNPDRISYLYKTVCVLCNKDKGYVRPKDFLKSCLSCAAKQRYLKANIQTKTLTRQKISCTQRQINVTDFQNFTTPVNEKARLKLKHSGKREECFNRDNFTCQVCDIKGATLNAHHIANFSNNEILRQDLQNLITLCENCHKAFHSKYGRKGNTPEQLNEFIFNRKRNKKELYLLTGAPASGKSWVAQQLTNFEIIDSDIHSKKDLVSLCENAQKPLLTLTVGISTFIKRNPQFDIKLIVIRESLDVVQGRMLLRGGKITDTITRRIKRMDSLSKESIFSGSSQEVLTYLST